MVKIHRRGTSKPVLQDVNAFLVNAGVDTLVVNGYYQDSQGVPVRKRELASAFADRLEDWKKQSQMRREPCPTDFDFEGATLLMQPNGAGQGQWQWMLKSPDLTLYISRGMWNGVASVRFTSRYLWATLPLPEAIIRVHELLSRVFGEELTLQPSAIDLCADVAGWPDLVSLDKKRHFVSRSRLRDDDSETDTGLKVSGFSYGLRDTGLNFSARGPMSLTIYDKTLELRRSGKLWFVPLWQANGWDEEKYPVVLRVEARFRREVLRDLKWKDRHGIEDAYELEEVLPVLWAYAVGHVGGGEDGLPDGWLRCVLPTGDSNRTRWPTHPGWEVVQRAFLQSYVIPPHFGKIIRKEHEERNVLKALEALIGYSTSVSAWEGGALADPHADFSMFLHWFAVNGADLLEKRGRDFAEEVQRKLVKFGLKMQSADSSSRAERA